MGSTSGILLLLSDEIADGEASADFPSILYIQDIIPLLSGGSSYAVPLVLHTVGLN